MKKKISALLAIVLILSGFGVAQAVNDDRLDWYCYQKDVFHRGMAFGEELLNNPISIGWEVQHGQKPVGTILISKSMAIVTGEKGLVSAYSVVDGSVIWRRDFGQPLLIDGTIMEEVMLCCFAGGKIVGLDINTGGSLWENVIQGDVVSPPIPYLTNFYVYTSKNMLVTISAVSGFIYAQVDAKSSITNPMTLQSFGDYNVSMIGLTDKSELFSWEFYTGKTEILSVIEGNSFKLPVITHSETIIIPDSTGKVRCMDHEGKKQYWMIDLGDQLVSAPCLFQGGAYIACATKSGTIKAIQIGSGNVAWEVKAKGPISQPLISVGYNIVAVTDSGIIQVLDIYNGTEVSAVKIDDPIVTNPSYSIGGVFVGTKTGRIICAKGSTGVYKFSLDQRVVVCSPGTDKNVELSLEGPGSDMFIIIASGFPCRCKIIKAFTPEQAIRPNNKVVMKLTIDPTAPSAVYDVQIEVRTPTTPAVSLRQSLTIIVSKPEEMLKSNIEISYPAENQMKVNVNYQNSKFGRSIAGIMNYNRDHMKFKNLAVNPSFTKIIDEKSGYYSFDASIPGKLIYFYSGKDSLPEVGQVFEVFFDVLASGEGALQVIPMCRATNGQPVPSDPLQIPYKTTYKAAEHVVKLQIGNLKATIDGKEVTLKVAPYINSGKTMVPLRFVGDALGAEVIWTASDKSVVYKNSLPTGAREIKMWIGKTTALVDGKEIAVKPAPEIKAGNTCVGLSFVSANFGCKTEWDPATKTVTIKFTK
ncbi:MAG: PQQ-binding-like beta-propeller repeat protein [Caldisericia bacterium]|nr:PQQ-binding-like beta-propeller repeat protein [Caldisericia bacterium]